ncbi:MAG: hypothetical protein EBR06_05365, partial [Acidimicrobiia bacterium]|nr:hypothetical protein [Acidimicrobiia bacterium]
MASATTVSFTGLSLTGTGNGNYTLTAHATESRSITAKALTVSGLSSSNKVYDGTTTASVSGTAALQSAITAGTGLSSDGKPYSVDSVSVTGTPAAAFNSKDVASATTVSFTGLSLTGTGNGNYTLTAHATESSRSVSRKTITVSGLSSIDKEYDGSQAASVSGTAALQSAITAGTGASSDGKPYSVDSVSVTGTPTAAFNSKNVTAATTVSFTGLSLTGTGNGNYTLSAHPTVSNVITAKALTMTGTTIASKAYDASPNAGTLTVGTLTGFVSPETVTATAVAADYASANVGTRASTVTYTLLDGTDGNGGYSLASQSVNGVITAKTLSVTAPSIASRAYNGSTTAGAVTVGTLSGFVGTETVTATGAAAAYSSKNVGTYAGVVITYTLSDGINGGLATNYSLANGTATGEITQKTLSVTAPTITSRAYDGTTTAGSVTVGTLSGFVGSETVTATGTAANFSSANIGSYPGVVVTYTLGNGTNGGLATNYSLANGSATGTITAKELLIRGSFEAADKFYNGNKTATLASQSFTLSGLVSGEDVGVNVSLEFDTKDFGVTKTVSIISAELTGTAKDNYSLTLDASRPTDTAAINKLALTVGSPTITSKQYDASATAGAVTVGTLSGFVGSETVTATGAAAAYSSANVGTYVGVVITYTLADGLNGGLATNYSLANGSATGQITAKPLSVTAPSIASRAYNRTATAGSVTVGTLSGFVGSQTVTATGAAADYSSANIGTYTGVVITYTLADGTNGGLASNYSLANGSATGVITAKQLTIGNASGKTFAVSNKVYDGGKTATVDQTTLGLVGVESGDTVTLTAAADFADKDVANGKTVSLTSSSAIGGANAGNYSLSLVGAPTTTA